MHRTRGRPKLLKFKKDFGTPELIQKRLLNMTTEPLDLCLQEKIIDQKQHWCGIRFRWLSTLKFGLPSTKAYDPARSPGREIDKNTGQVWLQEKQKEYNHMVFKLKEIGALRIVSDTCVYNIMPEFLLESNWQSLREIYKLQEGLSLLIKENGLV